LTFLREPSFGRAWLICEREIPVGYTVLTFGYSLEYIGRDAFIDEFYPRESHRGRGVGTQGSGVRRARGASHPGAVDSSGSCPRERAAQEVYRRAGYADHDHHLMSKWIERSFAKPGAGSH